MPAAASTVRQCDFSTSTTGIRRAACARIALAKTGLSAMPTRTQRPTATSRKLATNGTRHPHAVNSSGATAVEAMRNTRLDVMIPTGSPSATKLPNRPRRPCGACSTDISTAPPHSPPSAKPWTNRSVTSSAGAHAPMDA